MLAGQKAKWEAAFRFHPGGEQPTVSLIGWQVALISGLDLTSTYRVPFKNQKQVPFAGCFGCLLKPCQSVWAGNSSYYREFKDKAQPSGSHWPVLELKGLDAYRCVMWPEEHLQGSLWGDFLE